MWRFRASAEIRGITEIFRESAALRGNRERARLKFLFLRHGWTAERFQKGLESRLGFPLDPAVPEIPPEDPLQQSNLPSCRVLRQYFGPIVSANPTGQKLQKYEELRIDRGRFVSRMVCT